MRTVVTALVLHWPLRLTWRGVWWQPQEVAQRHFLQALEGVASSVPALRLMQLQQWRASASGGRPAAVKQGL